MKFATATLFAATAAAAAVQRQSESPVYEVSAFYAKCVYDYLCNYSFQVIRSDNSESTGFNCSAKARTERGNLPEVKRGLCQNTERTFRVIYGEMDNLLISVSDPISKSIGAHETRAGDIQTDRTVDGPLEFYDGPREFTLFAPTS